MGASSKRDYLWLPSRMRDSRTESLTLTNSSVLKPRPSCAWFGTDTTLVGRNQKLSLIGITCIDSHRDRPLTLLEVAAFSVEMPVAADRSIAVRSRRSRSHEAHPPERIQAKR